MNNEDNDIVTLHPMVNGKIEAGEFNVTAASGLTGRPIMELGIKDDVLISVIARKDGKIVIPSGRDKLEAGDSVIIITPDKSISGLSDIVRRGGARK